MASRFWRVVAGTTPTPVMSPALPESMSAVVRGTTPFLIGNFPHGVCQKSNDPKIQAALGRCFWRRLGRPWADGFARSDVIELQSL
jgi:hypothetical protein